MNRINIGDRNTINKIITSILLKEYDLKYVFYDNFQIIKDYVEDIIIKTLSKFTCVKKINNGIFTEFPSIHLDVDGEKMAITYNGIIKYKNNSSKETLKISDLNSITITNIITSILQYDFRIKYELINFNTERDAIEQELLKRINLNQFHNIEATPYTKTKLKNIFLKITDKSKKNVHFNILITPKKIII